MKKIFIITTLIVFTIVMKVSAFNDRGTVSVNENSNIEIIKSEENNQITNSENNINQESETTVEIQVTSAETQIDETVNVDEVVNDDVEKVVHENTLNESEIEPFNPEILEKKLEYFNNVISKPMAESSYVVDESQLFTFVEIKYEEETNHSVDIEISEENTTTHEEVIEIEINHNDVVHGVEIEE